MPIILKPAAYEAIATDAKLQHLLSRALEPDQCTEDVALVREALLNRGLAFNCAARQPSAYDFADERE